jgi:hypothetical protein
MDPGGPSRSTVRWEAPCGDLSPPSSEDPPGIPGGTPQPVQWAGSRPISRRKLESDSGFPFPLSARRIAVSKRWAFFGDRSRCAVSIRPASSAAGISATSFERLRRTMTISWSSTTRSKTEASLSRKFVYVVSTARNPLSLYCTRFLYVSYASNPFTTFPCTSVSRKSRPWKR